MRGGRDPRGTLAVARNESLGAHLSRTPIARAVVKRSSAATPRRGATVAADLADAGLLGQSRAGRPHRGVRGRRPDAVLTSTSTLIDRPGSGRAGGRVRGLGLSRARERDGPRLGDDARPPRERHVLRAAAASVGVPVMVGMGPADRRRAGRWTWADDLQGRGLDVGVTAGRPCGAPRADCRHGWRGHRVRLVKGGHRGEPRRSAYSQPAEIDKAYVRCAKTLLERRRRVRRSPPTIRA